MRRIGHDGARIVRFLSFTMIRQDRLSCGRGSYSGCTSGIFCASGPLLEEGMADAGSRVACFGRRASDEDEEVSVLTGTGTRGSASSFYVCPAVMACSGLPGPVSLDALA